MQAPAQITPVEEHATQSFQILNQLRMQSTMGYHSVAYCIDKCMDTEELYTLLRETQAPIKYRLQKSLEEKECVQHCGAKWDELMKMTVMSTNEQAIKRVQAEAMSDMIQQMQQM